MKDADDFIPLSQLFFSPVPFLVGEIWLQVQGSVLGPLSGCGLVVTAALAG